MTGDEPPLTGIEQPLENDETGEEQEFSNIVRWASGHTISAGFGRIQGDIEKAYINGSIYHRQHIELYKQETRLPFSEREGYRTSAPNYRTAVKRVCVFHGPHYTLREVESEQITLNPQCSPSTVSPRGIDLSALSYSQNGRGFVAGLHSDLYPSELYSFSNQTLEI